jgi:hypothetical protein
MSALDLIKNGVSEFLAFDGNPPKYLTRVEKLAWRICFKILEGGTWDQETLSFTKPEY